MTADARRCYVVHDAAGRILAVAPIAVAATGAISQGWRPLPTPDQRVAEVELTADQADLAPHELLESFELDLRAGTPCLRRRAAAP